MKNKMLSTKQYLEALQKKLDSDINKLRRDREAMCAAIQSWTNFDDKTREYLSKWELRVEEHRSLDTALVELSNKIDHFLHELNTQGKILRNNHLLAGKIK